MFGKRELGYTTVVGYLTSTSQLLQTLKAMNLQKLHGKRATQLLRDIANMKRQLGGKAKQVDGFKRMTKAKTTLDALASDDPSRVASLAGTLKYGLLINYAEHAARRWLELYELIPSHYWMDDVLRRVSTRHGNLIIVAKNLLACWWRLVQGGVDLPPLRVSMVMSLKRPHKYGCKHGTCCIDGCHGNQVEVSPLDGSLRFVLIHHKAVRAQSSLLGGPINPSPKPGSQTQVLTTIVIEKVLPLLYASMPDVPESSPLPMLPDVWSSSLLGELKYKELTSQAYQKQWLEQCVGKRSCLPSVENMQDPLGTLRLVANPFPVGTFNPSDNRRHFVTAMVQYQDEVNRHIGRVPELSNNLKALAARQVGHRQEQWEIAYDQMLKVNETKLVEGIMGGLKELLAKEVERSGLLKVKRKPALQPWLSHAAVTGDHGWPEGAAGKGDREKWAAQAEEKANCAAMAEPCSRGRTVPAKRPRDEKDHGGDAGAINSQPTTMWKKWRYFLGHK